MTEPLLTFPHPRITKPLFVAALHAHRDADRIVAGTYAKKDGLGRFQGGCAVGCSLESCRKIARDKTIGHSDHAAYERLLGVPQIIARLEDRIFEGLTGEGQVDWPVRFGEALPIGADLSLVWPRFALWLLSEEVPQHTKREHSLAALADVAALYREWCQGTKPPMEQWIKARQNAAAAAAYAAADAAAAAPTPTPTPPPTPPPPPPTPPPPPDRSATSARPTSCWKSSRHAGLRKRGIVIENNPYEGMTMEQALARYDEITTPMRVQAAEYRRQGDSAANGLLLVATVIVTCIFVGILGKLLS